VSTLDIKKEEPFHGNYLTDKLKQILLFYLIRCSEHQHPVVGQSWTRISGLSFITSYDLDENVFVMMMMTFCGLKLNVHDK